MMPLRIIPCLDIDKGKVVKGVNFKNLNEIGDPFLIAKKYYIQGADEISLLDVTATIENRPSFINLVKRLSKEVFVPISAGGGIKSVDDGLKMIQNGADKVIIGTQSIEKPSIITDLAKVIGSQAVVVSVDIKKVNKNKVVVTTKGGRNITDIDAFDFALYMEKIGAGELLVNSIDNDGKMNGYDIEVLSKLKSNINIPVIASGGAGSYNDIINLRKEVQVDAVLLASLFHKNLETVKSLKTKLRLKGEIIR